MITLRSSLMDQLCGEKIYQEVFSNLENLDAILNKEVLEIAYEQIRQSLKQCCS
jgi:hypothetical protein